MFHPLFLGYSYRIGRGSAAVGDLDNQGVFPFIPSHPAPILNSGYALADLNGRVRIARRRRNRVTRIRSSHGIRRGVRIERGIERQCANSKPGQFTIGRYSPIWRMENG